MARLVIVDDDPATLEWMSAALGARGHEVRAFTSPREALSQLGEFTPDLIVSDILMPEIDGLTFAKLVRRCHGTPVMFVSVAKREAEAVLAAAVGYVQKPATIGDVREAVERVLGREAADNTILIVEDDSDVREIYRSFLEPRFVVLEAADGREALAVLRSRAVDLVIADVHMPVMNGAELVRHMRADRALARMPVIVQTCDQTAIGAPVWRELSVAQVVPKDRFLMWLAERIDARVGSGASAQ